MARTTSCGADTLNDPILVAFKSAIQQMTALPASDPRSWNNQAKIHNDFCLSSWTHLLQRYAPFSGTKE